MDIDRFVVVDIDMDIVKVVVVVDIGMVGTEEDTCMDIVVVVVEFVAVVVGIEFGCLAVKQLELHFVVDMEDKDSVVDKKCKMFDFVLVGKDIEEDIVVVEIVEDIVAAAGFVEELVAVVDLEVEIVFVGLDVVVDIEIEFVQED